MALLVLLVSFGAIHLTLQQSPPGLPAASIAAASATPAPSTPSKPAAVAPVVPQSPASAAQPPDASISVVDAKVARAADDPPRAVLGKIDAHLARGLERLAGGTPLNVKTARLLGIPMNDEGTVCVDLEAAASEGLLAHIAAVEGTMDQSPDPSRIVTATVPFSALQALAARGDVRSVAIAIRTITTKGVRPAP